MDTLNKKNLAVDLFRSGYNCSQALVVAFHHECGLTKELAERISAPFGGGFGRQREICGAVSGMGIVLGSLTPYNSDNKTEIYDITKELSEKFKNKHNSIVCKEILKSSQDTTIDSGAYYGTKPCERCVEDAARIIAEHINRLSNKKVSEIP